MSVIKNNPLGQLSAVGITVKLLCPGNTTCFKNVPSHKLENTAVKG